TRKLGCDGTIDGGGVQPRESCQSVETRSKEQGQPWRGWDDHRQRQGLPACLPAILRASSLASFCSSRFHSRTREPLLPPPSAVISNRVAWGNAPGRRPAPPGGWRFTP